PPISSPYSHCFILFFSPYRAHLDLPSFPTRRSSDLADQRGQIQPTRDLQESRVAVNASAFGVELEDAEWARLGKPTEPLLAAPQDRKSTRLNSSHVEISYAVFCLKKKKKEYKDTAPR